MKYTSRIGLFTLALATIATVQAQTTLRFQGAAALEKMIRPLVAEVGAAHGAKLELAPNSTGRGLSNLAAGKAEVAMFAGELNYFAAQANETTPGSIDTTKLKVFPLGAVPAVIIVHPSNLIATFTNEQIRGIFSGKIGNWKDLGGADLPIVVALAGPNDGVRSVVTLAIMQAAPYAPAARITQNAPDLNKVVAQIPGAVSFMSVKNVAPEVRAVPPAQPILVPYALITLGEPAEPLKAVIADLQARLK